MTYRLLAALLLLTSALAQATVNDAMAALKKGDTSVGLAELNTLANTGDMSAQLTLASLYASGQLVTRDDKAATDWFSRAAVGGNSFAQYLLAGRYEKGLGITADKKIAEDWYRKAAHQGQTDAQYRLGQLAIAQSEQTHDYSQVLYWFGTSALAGNSSAQLALGLMYYQGKGVKRDTKMAIGWLRKAGAQGNNEALLMLGKIYQSGDGAIKDLMLARAFYGVGATGSSPDAARRARDALTDHLSQQERDYADGLAQDMAKPNNFARALDAYLAATGK